MEFYDVSNWFETSVPSTKGTREKLVLIKPGTEDYYFLKFPMVRVNRDYTPENWSEILAYEIGTALGFKVLRYALAAYKGRIGCISKNMTTTSNNESLVEGHSILSSYDSTYDPSNKNTYNRYTFEFVKNALKAYNATFYIKDFIRTIIFDAIIGNSDRHQSNWGIIQSITASEVRPARKSLNFPFGKSRKNTAGFALKIEYKSAPIYDSGCCLGREFGELQIQQHLDIQSKFDKYIRNGVSELRTGKTLRKPSHEELIRHIKNANNGEFKAFVEDEIKRVLRTYNPEYINKLILNIDDNLPDQYREKYGLTFARKEFAIRVINTRINNLKNI